MKEKNIVKYIEKEVPRITKQKLQCRGANNMIININNKIGIKIKTKV